MVLWQQERSPSPSSSVSQLAASFTQRVGSFLGNMAPRSPGMPTDAELEAEAERERDRTRLEAERILTREAEERRQVEERVLAMMESTRSLPPPPSRSRTASNPPSPVSSQKEGQKWWTAAKNRLTPTKDKDSLTPAQQIIQEAKSREKDKKGKGKDRDQDLGTAPLNLSIPQPPQRKPVPGSPSSPTPSRPNLSNLPPNLTPSPMRSMDLSSSSPSREAPPIYAQFNQQGALDVPGTLLTIAKRFEKLEKWTVGHVRALEERMSDVERWLVDKEKEKVTGKKSVQGDTAQVVQDMKNSITELEGRLGELGREMATLVTSPSNLSSGPSREPALVSIAPQTTSTLVVHDTSADVLPPEAPLSPVSTPHHSRLVSVTARESTSPPMASSKSSGTRLPYPTGDYATPPDSTGLFQGPFSPPHSPSSSISSATRTRPLSVGLGLGITPRTSSSSLTSSILGTSPQARPLSPPTQSLPPPKSRSPRPTSVSPTPRKRYTVALGEPIVSPPDLERHHEHDISPRPQSSISTAFFSSSPGALTEDPELDGANDLHDETIGKAASIRFMSGDYKSADSPSPASKRRLRAQSAYGVLNIQNLQPPQTPITPLKPRFRSHSTERLAGVTATGGVGPGPESNFPTGKFVDPLVLRKQDKEGMKIAMPKPVGKVPIGQLVAFFDEKKS
ncbi:hypothetical protein DXG03_006034 [Asterophora parasitica]|uniref:Uncharacterized protein n=1 Tax=Asterophora parasitica TaxID=117018 RepID=A0A9P7G5X1_9AGAR|nr:hypothetical protein DXG03_006034 [Asterophora parasitica]